MDWFFPGRMLNLFNCYTLGTLKNLGCNVWWVPSIMHYRSLIENRNLQSVCPTPNGKVCVRKLYPPQTVIL